MKHRPRRSVLYLPGANEKALAKAKTLAADSLIFDLEDSVAPHAKAQARAHVAAAIASGGFEASEVVIRINGLDTPWGQEDLAMARAAEPDALLIPKVENCADLKAVAFGIPLWAMMEKPLALLNARELAACGLAICFVLGTNDLLKETRASAGSGRMALLSWLSTTVLAARSAGLDVIDGVFNDFKDEAGFQAECEQGRDLGMDGKTLIHPAQIETCNRVFAPTAADIAWSLKIISEFALAENVAKGVLAIDGKMIERLHLAMAQRTIEIARAIGHV